MPPIAHHDHLRLFGKFDERRDGGRIKHLAVDLQWTAVTIALFSDLDSGLDEFACPFFLPLPEAGRRWDVGRTRLLSEKASTRLGSRLAV
jgi:hypothetical protein